MTQTLVKTIADFSTTLVSKVAVGDTTATLTSGLDEDGVQLPTGTYGFTIDRNNSQKEHFTATLTGSALTNIKHVTRGTGTASTGFANTHRKGAEVVITDHVALKRIMDVLDGTTQFDSSTILGYDGTATATTPNQLVTKAQLDATALGSVTVTTVVLPGNAGETVSAGNLLYLDVADGEWKKCDADTAATVDNIILGIAQGAGTDGVAITGGVMLQGLDANQTGLTNNTAYYASNTAGAITSTPGTTEVSVGVSRSATSLLFFPRYNQQLTENQQDALAGTSGTPSATNKFVTNDDTATSGADKILRLDGSGKYPANDGTQITGVAVTEGTFTASGDIAQNAMVYISANDTVKKLYPSAQGTGASVTTAPSHITSPVALPLSTNGYYLYLTGGSVKGPVASPLYAQVRYINAGETDFTNGSEANVYTTGNGVCTYRACQIGTDKFLVIFQADTAGAAAGIKAVVLSVSGTTVTVGSVANVETTGNRTYDVACCKLDTDKALIVYTDDAASDTYSKVLTVSGTTITQNTPALIKAGTAWNGVGAGQLGTDSAVVTYNANPSSLYGVVVSVSGTTITVNSEQTLVAGSSYYSSQTLGTISSSKLLLLSEDNTTNNVRILTISGSTITAGSALSISGGISGGFGMHIISATHAIVSSRINATSTNVSLLDISGATPTSVAAQTLSQSTDSNTHYRTTICKVSPWTYVMHGSVAADADYIIKLTPSSTARFGVAESAILSGATGQILFRYCKHPNFSGLTAGSIYYIDDDAAATAKSSLAAPTLGFAVNATTMLLQ